MRVEDRTCDWCENKATVVVNGKAACSDHLDTVFGEVGVAQERLHRLFMRLGTPE